MVERELLERGAGSLSASGISRFRVETVSRKPYSPFQGACNLAKVWRLLPGSGFHGWREYEGYRKAEFIWVSSLNLLMIRHIYKWDCEVPTPGKNTCQSKEKNIV